MKRRELREHIFKLLFFIEFHNAEEIPEQQQLYFEKLGELKDQDQSYMQEKSQSVRDHLPEINRSLEQATKGWKMERMGRVELTILRLAVYEMKYDEDIPTSVAINEAVELGKIFGGEDSSAFINGILAKLVLE